jgi:hypothetical protein
VARALLNTGPMKKLIAVVLVLGVGIWWFKARGGDGNTPAATYGQFMKALRSTEIGTAKQLASGDQAMDGIAAFEKREAGRFRVRGSMTIHRAVYTVESESQEDGVLYLDILEELRTNPPGTTSGMGTANVWLRHEVEMQNIDGDWKVLAFRFEFEDAEGLDGVDVDNAHRWF